ncbi:MAG: TPM domain-containing protein [Brevinematales bacterium]|nr:TPM domain-containing protein [Brevinematales bacterium]
MEAGKRNLNPKLFLSKEEQYKIIETIREVEKKSICEIRLHIAKKIKGDIIEEAKKIFNALEMYNTRERTGVLFFLSIKDRKFAVIGDEGINNKVGENFWVNIANEMESYFRKNMFGEGIVYGIQKIGQLLEKHFPIKKDDINELPDEISFEK